MTRLKKSRIAVVVQSSRGYGREILAGVASYSRTHRTWSIFHDERVLLDPVPEWLKAWGGDGLLAGIETEALADLVRQQSFAAVDLHGEIDIEGVPKILPDQAVIVRLAFEHLREVGFKRVAYCGFSGVNYSRERENSYRRLAQTCGMNETVINSRYPHELSVSHIEADGLIEQDVLTQWLLALEKPTGVIACNDIRASQVLNACRTAGLSVPDEVGVMGIDNDRCVCALCDPPLTSVDLNAAHIGFLASQTLDDLIAGRQPESEHRLVAPTGVIVRQSTSLLDIEDEDVAQAMRFIRDHAPTGIGVDDVVRSVHVSRSTIERRFKRLVGRSIKSEINRHRLGQVKELLATTDYPLSRVATLVGFANAEYMISFFKKSTGMTPGQYRKGHTQVMQESTISGL